MDDPETIHWGPFHLARQSFLILLELFNLDIERENSPVMFWPYPRMPEVRPASWLEGGREREGCPENNVNTDHDSNALTLGNWNREIHLISIFQACIVSDCRGWEYNNSRRPEWDARPEGHMPHSSPKTVEENSGKKQLRFFYSGQKCPTLPLRLSRKSQEKKEIQENLGWHSEKKTSQECETALTSQY